MAEVGEVCTPTANSTLQKIAIQFDIFLLLTMVTLAEWNKVIKVIKGVLNAADLMSIVTKLVENIKYFL